MLRDVEQETYESIWAVPQYQDSASPGEQCVKIFKTLTRGTGSVLDAGCGQGKGSIELLEMGFYPTLLDLTDQRLPELQGLTFAQRPLWDDLRDLGWFDWVYCCDVLEHLPQEFTMLAVARMLQVARQGLFLSIGFDPDNFGAYIGKTLHQTVKDFSWWKSRLNEVGRVQDSRDLIGLGTFYLVNR
jgi:SAM-dependent methyltransferase